MRTLRDVTAAVSLAIALPNGVAPALAQTLTPTRALFNFKDSLTTVERRAIGSDSQIVAVELEGSLRSLAEKQGDDDSRNTSASGSVGVSVALYSAHLHAFVNAAGTLDTLTSDHGRSLLYPTAGGIGHGASFLVDWRQLILDTGSKSKWLKWLIKSSKAGYHVYFGGSPAAWSVPREGSPDVIKASVISMGALGTWEAYHDHLGSSGVSILIDVGVAYRRLGGDLASSRHDTTRTRILSTHKTDFFGLESGMTITLNRIRTGVSIYQFGGEVPGLSNTQLTFGVSVSSPFMEQRKKRSVKTMR